MDESTRVCGDCWETIHPDRYAPYTFNMGTCARCGNASFVYRVSQAERAADVAASRVEQRELERECGY